MGEGREEGGGVTASDLKRCLLHRSHVSRSDGPRTAPTRHGRGYCARLREYFCRQSVDFTRRQELGSLTGRGMVGVRADPAKSPSDGGGDDLLRPIPLQFLWRLVVRR